MGLGVEDGIDATARRVIEARICIAYSNASTDKLEPLSPPLDSSARPQRTGKASFALSSVTLDLRTRAGSWNRPLSSLVSHLASQISNLASFISISSARANGSQKREPEVSILLGASPTGEARATLIVGREFEPELLLFLMETDQSSTVRTPQAKIS